MLVTLLIASCGGTAEETTVVEEESTTEETVAPATTVAKETAWYPLIRTASQPYKIGYGDGLAGISFTDSVT
ncbi:MAG: hypothetical protein CMM95_02390, partial [Rickettsiales bacterium]|nr:hypothetical protein [Rickettsiales bacterium]